MARFRNDFGEDRVAPMLGYQLVEDGETITVPDDEWEHWDAGGWKALDPNPAPAAAAAQPAPPAPTPPAKTTTTATAAVAAEGAETA